MCRRNRRRRPNRPRKLRNLHKRLRDTQKTPHLTPLPPSPRPLTAQLPQPHKARYTTKILPNRAGFGLLCAPALLNYHVSIPLRDIDMASFSCEVAKNRAGSQSFLWRLGPIINLSQGRYVKAMGIDDNLLEKGKLWLLRSE